MGANQSRNFNFYCDFAISHSYIESLETDSPIHVFHKLKEDCLTTVKQMEAVSIIIYEKAVLKPHLSLKCAQLVKELEAEACYENGDLHLFHVVFVEYLSNLIISYAEVYDDSKMNAYTIQRGKDVATFLANLYLADALILTPIIEICQIVKKKETPKNAFFIETIVSLIEKKMKTENVTIQVFNYLVINGMEHVSSDSEIDPEEDSMIKFSEFLDKISKDKHYELYDYYEDFKGISKNALEVQVKILVDDVVKMTNDDFTYIYRDIALGIHYIRPNETRNFLNTTFIKNIERYNAIKKPELNENLLKSCNELGKTVAEFFNSRLLDEQPVEYFLDAVKIPKIPVTIFINMFINILNKYRGKNIYTYLEYFKKCTRKLSVLDTKAIIAAVEDYVVDKEVEVDRNGKKTERVGMSLADLPDFRGFTSKRLFATSNSSPVQDIFVCENRPSCYFASRRGLELLNRHIGHKFFSIERIEICVKMTAKSVKFNIGDDIAEIYVREMKTYLPYFVTDIELSRKLYNFSDLLVSLYETKLINNFVLELWLASIFENIKDREHKYQDNLLDIFSKIFNKLSLQFLRDEPEMWGLNLTRLEAFEFKMCKFDDAQKFGDILGLYKLDHKDVHLKKLKSINIPNNKFAMKLISRFLVKMHTENNMHGSKIAELIVFLPDAFRNKLDKNILRAEFQNALCISLGHLIACCKTLKSIQYIKAENFIDFVEVLCKETIVTRLGLATILNAISEFLNPNLYPVFELIKYFTEKVSHFFYGAKPLPNKVEKILLDVIEKIKNTSKDCKSNKLMVKKLLKIYENILEDSKIKKKQEDGKKVVKSEPEGTKLKKYKDLRDSSSSPPPETLNNLKNKEKQGANSSNSESSSKPNNSKKSVESSTSAAVAQEKSKDDNESVPQTDQNKENQASRKEPEIQPKMSPEDIKEYEDYCDYFNSIEHKTSNDDKIIFDPILISSIRLKNKEQVMDIAKKFIERILAAQSSIIFFIQNVQKIGNAIQNVFKIKNQKISFQKILIDEIFGQFKNQELLLEFMCELYNNSFVNKSSMIAFVDKFKSQSPENINLMHTFIRTCAIRLSSQGDKEQLIQIRTIARSVKNLPNYDEDLKFLAQDLANSTNSLIQLLENGQNKPQVMTESAEKLVDDFFKNVLKNPQIYVKSAYKLDGKMKELLIQKIEKIIKEVPKFEIQIDEFMNLMEFVAELYNLDVLKNEFLTWTIEILMQSSTNEICSQSIENLFTKCGQKMENVNKHKLDIYMKFFEACLAEDNNEVRSKNFRKIQKLKNRKWKNLEIPKNFYEDFLMLFSMNDAKIDELVEILSCDEEEIEKFIQILWKIILKDPPHPSYAALCLEIGKSCENFEAKLTNFFTARCITFIGFNAEMFNENVKERLGKVMTFIAEIYDNNLIPDKVLEMFLDQKLTSKLPTEFVLRIFSILSKCQRLDESQNDELKNLVKNFDKMSNQGFEVQIESLIKSVESLQTCGKGSLQPNTLIL